MNRLLLPILGLSLLLLGCVGTDPDRRALNFGPTALPGHSDVEKNCYIFSDIDHGKVAVTSLFEKIDRANRFSELYQTFKELEPEIHRRLSDPDPDDQYTLFIPTNGAWDVFKEEHPDLVLQGDTLRKIIRQHITYDRIPYRAIRFGLPVATTFNFRVINFRRNASRCITINGGASLMVLDEFAQNGVVHIIDRVVMPDEDVWKE